MVVYRIIFGGMHPLVMLDMSIFCVYFYIFSSRNEQEGNVLLKEGRMFLFNDALNTFYLWLYGVGHMVSDHLDSERGNPLLPHGLLFLINSKGSFICTIPQVSTYHSLCYTSRGVLAGTRNSSMGPPHEGSIQRPITP